VQLQRKETVVIVPKGTSGSRIKKHEERKKNRAKRIRFFDWQTAGKSNWPKKGLRRAIEKKAKEKS